MEEKAIGTLADTLPAMPHRSLSLRARGHPGEEGQDYGYKFTNARRRSNSSSLGHDISNFKTKFETVESDPMFEEDFHGARDEDADEHMGLEKAESAESTSAASVEEEDHAKKD